jgi:hypothetical protein
MSAHNLYPYTQYNKIMLHFQAAQKIPKICDNTAIQIIIFYKNSGAATRFAGIGRCGHWRACTLTQGNRYPCLHISGFTYFKIWNRDIVKYLFRPYLNPPLK